MLPAGASCTASRFALIPAGGSGVSAWVEVGESTPLLEVVASSRAGAAGRPRSLIEVVSPSQEVLFSTEVRPVEKSTVFQLDVGVVGRVRVRISAVGESGASRVGRIAFVPRPPPAAPAQRRPPGR